MLPVLGHCETHRPAFMLRFTRSFIHCPSELWHRFIKIALLLGLVALLCWLPYPESEITCTDRPDIIIIISIMPDQQRIPYNGVSTLVDRGSSCTACNINKGLPENGSVYFRDTTSVSTHLWLESYLPGMGPASQPAVAQWQCSISSSSSQRGFSPLIEI